MTEDVHRLRALTGRVWREAFYLVETNYTGGPRRRRRGHHQRTSRVPQPALTTASKGGCTSRSPSTCRPTRSGSSRARSGSTTTGTSARSVTPRRSRCRNLELLRAQQAEGESSAFLHFNLGTEYSMHRRFTQCAWPALTRLDARRGRRRGGQGLRARAASATGRGAPQLWSAPGTRSFGPGRDSSASRVSPTSSSRRRSPRSRSAARTTRSATGSSAWRWATRRRGTSPRAERARSSPGSRSPSYTCVAERSGAPASCSSGASQSIRTSSAPSIPTRPPCCAGGLTPEEVVARIEDQLPTVPPAARFMLADALYRYRRDGRRGDRVPNGSARPSEQRAGPRPAGRDAAQSASVRRGRAGGGGRPGGRRVRHAGQPRRAVGPHRGRRSRRCPRRERSRCSRRRPAVPAPGVRRLAGAVQRCARSSPPCRLWRRRCSA